MKVVLKKLTSALEFIIESDIDGEKIDLVLVFGNAYSIEDPFLLENFTTAFPKARILGCSTAGDLLNGETYDNSIVYAAIKFDHTKVHHGRVDLPIKERDEIQAGRELATQLKQDDLSMVILLSEGLAVDCDELIVGMREVLGPDVPFFGGLAADDLAFEQTVVLDNDGASSEAVVAVGLCGDRIKIRTKASMYNHKGVKINVTKSIGNIVHEINGKPALPEYEAIIRNEFKLDVMSILHFPFLILDKENKEPLYARTIHEFDRSDNTLLAASAIPEGPASIIDLQKVEQYFDDAQQTAKQLIDEKNELGLVITCAARRGALGDSWKKEYKFVHDALEGLPSIGFYSYGEIGRSHFDNSSIIHNQTINIATFYES